MGSKVEVKHVHFLHRPQLWLCVVLLAFVDAGVLALLATPPVHSKHHTGEIVKKYPQPDCRRVACIALTFDDGPSSITTPRILDTLEKEQVPATFFVVGSRVAANAKLIRRIHKNGMEIGNHSWSHPDMTQLKPKQIRQQITRTQIAIERAGAPAPTLFRPPYGAMDRKVKQNVPLTFILWTEDPRDWAATKPQQVIAVVKGARPGSVVDMHDIHQVTVKALPRIIYDLKKRGFHFVTASALLELRPGQKGVFYGYPKR